MTLLQGPKNLVLPTLMRFSKRGGIILKQLKVPKRLLVIIQTIAMMVEFKT